MTDTIRESNVLYKKDTMGKIRTWQGYIKEDTGFVTYVTISGIHGGTLKTHEGAVKETALLSAKNKALSKLRSSTDSKLKSGYFDNIKEAEDYLPSKLMLLHRYDLSSDKIIFPCLVQPKLDGVCAGYVDTDDPHFKSRENNRFPKLDFIATGLKNLLDVYHGTSRAKMDSHGEFYSHGRKVSEVVEAIKGDNEEVLDELVFYIFDYMNKGASTTRYSSRLLVGSDMYVWKEKNSIFTPIRTLVANSHEEITKANDTNVKRGFEGSVVCNANGLYMYERRTYDKLKLKQLFSGEFVITGYSAEMQGEDELIVFELETKDKVKFSARPAWSHKKRKTAYDKKESYIGASATVEYRSVTQYGTPFHPVFVEVRNYE